MRPNRFHLPLASCFLLALLPLAGACTREPAESNASATPPATPATSAAPPAAMAPVAGQPAPTLGSEPMASESPAAAAVVRSTAIAHGHLLLTGDYRADSDAEVTCATADTALQLTFIAPGKPRVLILLDDLAVKGTSGTYKGQVSILASDMGESGFRQSGGKASADVTVDAAPTGKAVSGSFATTFTGEAGKGTVKGRFDRCVFKPEPADHP